MCTRCPCASIWSARRAGCRRVIERGTKGIDTLLSFAIFSIFPTLFLLAVFAVIMVVKLDWLDCARTLAMVAAYMLVHLCHHALAHPVPPRHEPKRSGRQHQGGG